MQIAKHIAPILALCLLTADLSTATILHDNGAPNQSDAQDISGFVAADDFTLSSASSLTTLTFWSSADVDPFSSQFSGSIAWAIYSNKMGLPGIQLAAGVDHSPTLTDTHKQILGTEEFQIQTSLPSVALNAGHYWLGLHETAFGTAGDGTPIYWDTTSGQQGSVSLVTSDPAGLSGWFQGLPPPGSDLAFHLNGTINGGVASPEPVLLTPAGLLCAWLIRRRSLARRAISARSQHECR